MTIIASKNVVQGKEINLLHKMKDFWVVLSVGEELDPVKGFDEHFFIIDEDLIYERIPNLKGQLDQPVDTAINVNYLTGEVNINKKHFHLGIPTHSAKSSRQANADFSFIKWVMYNPNRYLKIIITVIVLLGCAMIFGWVFYISMALYLAYEVLASLKERDMFKSGALCPAIVIDEKNQKIAAFTDLTLGGGNYPVIRIKKVELPKKYRKVGVRIPVAGAYQNTEKYSFWNYYNPLPLPSGVGDDSVIVEKVNSIPTIEWVKLNTEVEKLKQIPVEGYYPIDVEKTSWKNVDLKSIKWMKINEEKDRNKG